MRKSMRSGAHENDRLLTNVVASLQLNSFQTDRFLPFFLLIKFFFMAEIS